MAESNKIDEHTPVAKAKEGPFTSAGKVKGLLAATAVVIAAPIVTAQVHPDSDDFDVVPDEPANGPRGGGETPRLRRRRGGVNEPSLLALWSFGISTGMIAAILLYGTAWKFAGPVWGYGAALVPVAVTLFIVGGYPYLQRRNRLNFTAVVANSVFLLLTLIAGLGTVYDLWTVNSRLGASFRATDKALRIP